jgi:membrane associated rhomboid family serine protease
VKETDSDSVLNKLLGSPIDKYMSYSEDRTYGFGPWGMTKAVKYLILTNVGIFVLEYLWGSDLIYFLGLTPTLVRNGFVWQLVTYMFLHGGLFHILFNMFALWVFGCEIERTWGTREFVKYYFLTGVGAGLFTFLLSYNSGVPTIGASGAIFGILVAFAVMFPDRPIYLYFIFPLKAKYLVIFFVVVEFLASFRHTSDGIGHFAHLGGMLVGYLYIRADLKTPAFLKLSSHFDRFRDLKHRHRMKVLNRRTEEKRKLMERVDQILDKINQVGYSNLTREERKTLEQASQLLSEQSEKR